MTNERHHLPAIGMAEAQALYGVTARALRYYEDRGLLSARRDRLNYRCFDASARRRLVWISMLRRVGLPLRDIEAVLAAAESERAGAAHLRLEAHRRKLATDLAEVVALSRTLAQAADPLRSVA